MIGVIVMLNKSSNKNSIVWKTMEKIAQTIPSDGFSDGGDFYTDEEMDLMSKEGPQTKSTPETLVLNQIYAEGPVSYQNIATYIAQQSTDQNPDIAGILTKLIKEGKVEIYEGGGFYPAMSSLGLQQSSNTKISNFSCVGKSGVKIKVAEPIVPPFPAEEQSEVIGFTMSDSLAEPREWNADFNYPAFVSAYTHDRAYGGPEEGGWYYDAYHLVDSVPVNTQEEAFQAVLSMWAKYEDQNDPQSIGNVNSEGKILVMTEGTRGEQDRGQPQYE